MLTRCPAVALKVRLAFCPNAVLPLAGTRTGGPPTVSVAVKSGGTLFNCSVSLPTLFIPLCCTCNVYVPLAVSVCVSNKKICPAELLPM